MIIVDSDIIIWHLRGMPKISAEVKRLVNNHHLYVSPIVVAEIFAGARKKEIDSINKLFSSIRIIEINKEMGRIAGEYLNKFSQSHNLKIADALIAASAEYGKLKLWTLNKKHYPMFSKKDFYEI